MFWLIAAIAAWGMVHSWLASLQVRESLRRRFGEGAGRWYRLLYNAFSVISFAPILVLIRMLPDKLLYRVPPPWLYLMLAGQALAVFLIALTLFQTGVLSFLGLRQVLEGARPPRLVTNGFYRWVRHPLYLWGLIVLWLTPLLTLNMLITYLALTAYLIAGAAFEERKLAREFGAAYAEYRARTPMIIPLRGSPRP